MSREEPATIEELIEYTKRRLGEDILDDTSIEIDITEQQCLDLVSAAIQKWKTYAYDGCTECFFVIPTITGQTEYKLPQNTVAVYGYVPATEYNNMFSMDFQMRTHIGMNYKTYDLTTIEVTKEHIAMLDLKLGKKYAYTFNGVTKILTVQAGAETGSSIVAMGAKWTDEVPNIFNEIWIKEYTEALFQIQCARNILKFDGIKLPGNATINWKEILTEGKEAKAKLETEVITHWSRPIRFKRG